MSNQPTPAYPSFGWYLDDDGVHQPVPYDQPRLYRADTPAGQRQVEQVADALTRADQQWNAETGDNALDRDYLAHAARAAIEALRGEQ